MSHSNQTIVVTGASSGIGLGVADQFPRDRCGFGDPGGDLDTKVGELFRLLMDLLVVKQVRSVENVVTEGLRTIFHDLELAFEADVGPKYGKVSVEFFIRQGAKDDPLSHRGRPLEAFGGGPSTEERSSNSVGCGVAPEDPAILAPEAP